MNIPPVIVPRSHLSLPHLAGQVRVPVLEAAKPEPGAGLNDWLSVDTQESVKIGAVPGSELSTSCHQDTVSAITDKHRALHWAQEYLTVCTVINSHSVATVKYKYMRVAAVLDLELLTIYRAWQPPILSIHQAVNCEGRHIHLNP